MILIMSLKISPNLLTEDELGVERGFEVRILDLKSGKQKSFSLFVKTDAKPEEKQTLAGIKDFLKNAIKEGKK
jgi:hypothetical protein